MTFVKDKANAFHPSKATVADSK